MLVLVKGARALSRGDVGGGDGGRDPGCAVVRGLSSAFLPGW